MRRDIARRRKERCKTRNREIHEMEDKLENEKLKKRRIDDNGKFKIVIQKQKTQKREDAEEEEEEGIEAEEGLQEKGRKRRKISGKDNEYRILGEVIRGAELAEKVDWEERRREILENLRKEEEERVKKIEKAQRLSRGWELNRLC